MATWLSLLTFERFLCVMSREEQRAYLSGAPVTAEKLAAWRKRLDERNAGIDRIFARAYERQKEISNNKRYGTKRNDCDRETLL